jgi:carbon monoxide dehydrogenase subunit G
VLAHAAERKRAPGETKLGPTPPRRLDGVPGLKRTVTITASPDRVWSVVVDVDRWPERIPTVDSVERLDDGPLVVGSRTRLQQPRLPTAVWTVTELTPGASFTWESSSPGVLVTASHVVEPHPEGSQLTLAVDVSGPLSRIGWLMTRSLTEQYVETEASCMKQAAEDPPG